MTDTLKQWASAGKLGDAKLSPDGTKLSLDGDVTLDATQPLTVMVKNKTIRYSLASLFLQIVNPTQSLMAYRNACKQYKIQDVVKALDKPTVVAYFLGDQEEEGEEEGAVSKEEPVKERRSSSERRSKHHDRSKKQRDSKKRPSDVSAEPEPTKKKKKKVPMTNEQLFDNLNTVVDKRSAKTTREDELLHQALSADGFEVSPEELVKHKAALEKILPLEIPVGNSASILRPTTLAGRDFSRVLELYLETTKSFSKSSSSGSSKHKSKAENKKSDKSYLIGKKPVIVVPKGMTIPITMANAFEFFGNAKFVPREIAKKQQEAPPNSFSRKLSARLGGGLVEYELMDNPKAKLGENPREWDRIVAVIALGQSWQFKDWPGPYKNAVQLFGRTYGFYIGMEGDKVPAELEGWAVRRGKLNRDKRGLDSVTYASFWNGLDEWMAVHKPELLPKS